MASPRSDEHTVSRTSTGATIPNSIAAIPLLSLRSALVRALSHCLIVLPSACFTRFPRKSSRQPRIEADRPHAVVLAIDGEVAAAAAEGDRIADHLRAVGRCSLAA